MNDFSSNIFCLHLLCNMREGGMCHFPGNYFCRIPVKFELPVESFNEAGDSSRYNIERLDSFERNFMIQTIRI